MASSSVFWMILEFSRLTAAWLQRIDNTCEWWAEKASFSRLPKRSAPMHFCWWRIGTAIAVAMPEKCSFSKMMGISWSLSCDSETINGSSRLFKNQEIHVALSFGMFAWMSGLSCFEVHKYTEYFSPLESRAATAVQSDGKISPHSEYSLRIVSSKSMMAESSLLAW